MLPKSERTFSRNFDTGVFQAPAVGTIGNTGKTLLRGPGINNWDIGLARSFPIRERVRVQFRSEFYNGQFTAARNSRFIHFALKISFCVPNQSARTTAC